MLSILVLFSRQVIITKDNEGPVVNLANWIGLTGMILSVLVRIGSKYWVTRRWNKDDILIVVTMGFGIAHSILLTEMVENGLGQNQDTLSEEKLERYQKFGYASQLFYIPALCFGKLSTLFYLRALTPESHYAILNRATEIFVIVWALIAEISIAFQCQLPHSWAILSSQCFNTIIFWLVIGTFDILTDFAIVCLPIVLVWNLQMPVMRKTLVFCAFGTRAFILPFSIMRLFVLSHVASPSLPNQTLVSYHNYMWTTIQLNSAIFFACLPFLKPFMESITSGALASTVKPMDSSYSKSGSKLRTLLSSRSGGKSSRTRSSRVPQHLRTISSIQDDDLNLTTISPTNTSPRSDARKSPMLNFRFNNVERVDNPEEEELGSLKLRPDGAMNFSHIRRSTPEDNDQADRSTVGSDQMIIRRTTEWDVREDYDEVERGRRSLQQEEHREFQELPLDGEEVGDWNGRGAHLVG